MSGIPPLVYHLPGIGEAATLAQFISEAMGEMSLTSSFYSYPMNLSDTTSYRGRRILVSVYHQPYLRLSLQYGLISLWRTKPRVTDAIFVTLCAARWYRSCAVLEWLVQEAAEYTLLKRLTCSWRPDQYPSELTFWTKAVFMSP